MRSRGAAEQLARLFDKHLSGYPPEEQARMVARALGGQVKHWCPGCEQEWDCKDRVVPEGADPKTYVCHNDEVRMLCDECDTMEVRERLGGKWQ